MTAALPPAAAGTRRRHRRVLVGAVAACMPLLVAAAAVPDVPLAGPAAAPCVAVARAARRLTPAAWQRAEAALAPTLRIERGWYDPGPAATPPFPLAREIAALPAVAAAIGASGVTTTFLEHVAGTDLYQASTTQGTLLVESDAFVRAAAGEPARLLPSPPSARGGEWTTSEDLGTVDSLPVIVDHGPTEATGLDQDIQLTPWTGSGWGPACRVALRFASAYPVAARFCGDTRVCAAAAAMAGAVARAFDAHSSDGPPFAFGPAASRAAQAAAQQAAARGTAVGRPDFPQFGRDAAQTFSFGGDGPVPFALVVGGRSTLALIGHEGVGWRTSRRVLLAVFDPGGAPLAGIVIERQVAGLRSAAVLPPVLDRERH